MANVVLWRNNRIDERYEIDSDAVVDQFIAANPTPDYRERIEYFGIEQALLLFIGNPSPGLQSVIALPGASVSRKGEEPSCDQPTWDAMIERIHVWLFPS